MFLFLKDCFSCASNISFALGACVCLQQDEVRLEELFASDSQLNVCFSCAKCERPFRHGTEDTVTINRKTYHADCLSCDKCSKPYDGSFTPDALDQEALCLECTQAGKTKAATDNSTTNKEEKPAYVFCVYISTFTKRAQNGCVRQRSMARESRSKNTRRSN